ncbi:GTP cyclohydrolase [Flavobacterium magnum]|uniref:GTP cyclohydrolase n=1 Tax=Flavobacterium magnum TaxID=2162713 RepID=A0A2S0RHF4_9FLAO|nr:GTP cyclohydrolase [Flavobacterium magnum]AWA30710.1 GTP cyclohydrolase [Flavobacterium magnum]
MIRIKEADTPKLMREFVKFPFSLYKNHPYWVPPLIDDELAGFDRKSNPAFETAEAIFYLAFKDDVAVGRIVAIINWDEVNKQDKRKVRFGWFDFIDDIEVSRALIEKVYELGRKHQLTYAEGPMGFSNLDKVGMITEGFDEIGSMITWYNYPYYGKHMEQLGYVMEKEYLENKFPFANVKPEMFSKIQELIKKRYQLTPMNFTRTKDIMPYVDQMFDLFNRSYSDLSSFVAINDSQIDYFKKKYIGFINPEYIKFIFDKDENMIAFSIVMPSFSDALRKAGGRLFPFGFYHLLKARKNSKKVLFYLIGVLPEYQNKGVTAIVFAEYYKTFMEKGIKECIRTPELADNHAIHNIWKNFDPVTFRKRATFRKDI